MGLERKENQEESKHPYQNLTGNDEVDPIQLLLPEWLNGSEDFAEVLKENADRILTSLSQEDKAKLKALLPPTNKTLYD